MCKLPAQCGQIVRHMYYDWRNGETLHFPEITVFLSPVYRMGICHHEGISFLFKECNFSGDNCSGSWPTFLE